MEYNRRRHFRTNSSDSSDQDLPWSSSRPPKRPNSSWRQDNRWQFVWPNDKHRGIWGRWKDIFTNKGPDIFIAEQNTRQPERPIWSNWKTRGYQHPDSDNIRWDNSGKPFRQDEEFVGVFDFQRRDPDTKYDFATRRYRRPNDNVWSGVEWSRTKPHCPVWVRSANGRLDPPGRRDYGHPPP
ncbi:MAG: hypothetical protein ALECFALPRED_003262 [Alectoria fallacina]|uniref:Uncharacterized protein n=1 Tax=Alectoria fallacina TaxID=1903189 RepID=A0A8H3FM94_9LECA|nr:MAG: hypothetical protein ALECFALPRED_003262 [Alectoria fallacina]